MFALVTLVAGLAILIAIQTLTPSWRWPAGAAALWCAWFVGVWIHYFITVQVPGSMPENHDGLGVAIFTELTIGALLAVLIFALGALHVASKQPARWTVEGSAQAARHA